MNIYGNKINLINYKGDIFGQAKSLDVEIRYGKSGVYEITDRVGPKGSVFLKTNKTGILHEIKLDFGKMKDIFIIDVINKNDGKIASYQACSSPRVIEDNTIKFSVMEL